MAPVCRTTHRHQAHRQSGVSLIELMISITIGLILIAGVTTIYANIGAAGSENIARTRLTQQLRASMDYMSRELQKAGYANSWISGSSSVTGVNLDIIALFGDVHTTDATCSGTECDCVLYSYDANDDGEQGVGSASAGANQNTANFELFGIRKDGDYIDLRRSGKPHECDTGTWEALTDDEVKITTLTFELDTSDTVQYWVSAGSVTPTTAAGGLCPSGTCLERRKVNIVLTGQLADDSSISVTMEHQVAIKNDYLFEP